MMSSIAWHPWSEDAFNLATSHDMPALLAIVSPWIESSVAMETTTYSDPAVAAAIAASVVPIRVDATLRPDIRARYETGGIPGTAFLTPQGHLLTAAGYLTSEGMIEAIGRVSAYYRDNRDAVLTEVAERDRQATLATEPQGLVTSGTVTKVEKLVRSALDTVNGGFAGAPKRTHPEVVSFLLARYFRSGDDELSVLLLGLLKELCASPINDLVDGGFFHAAAREDYGEIDHAKLATDNAQMMRVLIRAARATGDAGLEAMASLLLEWAERVLLPNFVAAQLPDATYYGLTPAEREATPSPPATEVVIVEAAASLATAFLDAAVGLGEGEAGKTALAQAEALWKNGFDAEHGMAHTIEENLADRQFGLLGDQLAMLELLIRAFELGGHPLHQRRAIALAGLVETLFGDPGGGFYDRIPEERPIGHMRFRKKSLLQNGFAAQLFQRIAALTHNDHFREVAGAALRRFTEGIESHGVMSASIAEGCDTHIRGLIEVMVVGERADRATARLRLGALETFSPLLVVNLVDPVADPQILKIRDVEYDSVPIAFIYHGGERSGPYSDREKLGSAVVELGRTTR